MAKQLELELVVTWGPGSHLLVRTPAVGEAGGVPSPAVGLGSDGGSGHLAGQVPGAL